MRVLIKLFSSRAALIAPYLPIHHIEGAIISEPASANLACLHNEMIVSSLATYPEESKTPSCPWVVYGSKAASVMIPQLG